MKFIAHSRTRGSNFQLVWFKREEWRLRFSSITCKINKLRITWPLTSSLQPTFNWLLRHPISNIKCRCHSQVSNILNSLFLTPSHRSTPPLVRLSTNLACHLPTSINKINTTTRPSTCLNHSSSYNLWANNLTLTINNKRKDSTLKSAVSWRSCNVRLIADFPSQNKQGPSLSTWFAKLRVTLFQNWVCRLTFTEAWLQNSQSIHRTWISLSTEYSPKLELKHFKLCTRSLKSGCRCVRIRLSRPLRCQSSSWSWILEGWVKTWKLRH